MPQKRVLSTTPWAVAHRGARDEAPENTLPAFERALVYPIDGIEFDVQMSADGVPVIFHDATLKRITGRRVGVAELNFSRLQTLDWGRWFGGAFSGTPVLTLEQVLASFGSRTRLLIEIKSYGADRMFRHTHRLTEKVVEMLSECKPAVSAERIFILSFDAEVLTLAHHLSPLWHYVLNMDEKRPNNIMTMPANTLEKLWGVDGKISRLSAPLVQWAGKRGLKVFTYTCNTRRQVQKALTLGVNAVLSDRPGWLTRYLGMYESTYEESK